ncbi:MAG: hypothetical protein HDT38_02825 [Clostridiales bacterium]|nr:hypothetical protein [Clostridiales bacterium]
MGHEVESMLLGAACVGAGVLILCLARPLEGGIVLIALLFLLVGVVFVATSAVMLRDKARAKRKEEELRAIEKELERLEEEKKAGLITRAEYRARRKEIWKDQ